MELLPTETVKRLAKAIAQTMAAYKQIEAADYSKLGFCVMKSQCDFRFGTTVIIFDAESQKPLACGIAILHPGDLSNEAHAEKIAARRACADYARQNFMRRFQAEEERNLYHGFGCASGTQNQERRHES